MASLFVYFEAITHYKKLVQIIKLCYILYVMSCTSMYGFWFEDTLRGGLFRMFV